MSADAVLVTGIGMVNPCGTGRASFWSAMEAGSSAITALPDPGHAGIPVHVAGRIHGFDPRQFVPDVVARRTGPIAQFALAAGALALGDADLGPGEREPTRCGVFLGVGSGSWAELESGLDALFHDGAAAIPRSVGIGWFAGAPLGQLSVAHELRGYSRTYVAGRASGAAAVHFGVQSILRGQNDVVLAGGTEASLTALGLGFHHASGELSPDSDPATAYQPFGTARTGTVLGEGSTILVLEAAEHARRRGARSYGEIASSVAASDSENHNGPVAAMTQAMTQAGVGPSDLGAVFPESCATREDDRRESRDLHAALADAAAEVPVCLPRALYGHLHGASFATELACALLALNTGTLPAGGPGYTPDSTLGLRIPVTRTRIISDTALISARSKEGLCVSAVIRSGGARTSLND